MQQTFIRINSSLKRFKQQSKLSTWIYRVAFNTGQTWLAARSRRRKLSVPFDEGRFPSGGAPGADARIDAQRYLGRMSPEERFLITAREITGLSYEEIAKITGANAGALRTRLSRLKEELRAMFPEKEPVVEEAVLI